MPSFDIIRPVQSEWLQQRSRVHDMLRWKRADSHHKPKPLVPMLKEPDLNKLRPSASQWRWTDFGVYIWFQPWSLFQYCFVLRILHPPMASLNLSYCHGPRTDLRIGICVRCGHCTHKPETAFPRSPNSVAAICSEMLGVFWPS